MISKQVTLPSTTSAGRPAVRPVAVATLVIVLYALLLAIASRMPDLGATWADPDSMMRLHEVRAFLAGQGWFDLSEPRLAPPLGMISHWSRYIDAPLAGLILLLTPLFGRETAELVTVNIWPPLLFLPFAAGVATIAYRFAAWPAVFATLLTLALSPLVTGVFRAGDIDHHNVQALLLVWLLASLVRADRSRRWAAFAGVMAATSLAIGLETLLSVVLAAAGLAIAWIVDGERWRRGLITFGLALAATTTLHFFATVPASRWPVGACDSLSIVYVMLATLGGLGTAAIGTTIRGRDDGPPGMLVRGGALIALGCALVSLTAVNYPACLAGPYGQVDPRLGPIWLNRVAEAQGLWSTAVHKPWLLPVYYVATGLSAWFGMRALRRLPAADRPAFGMVLALLLGCTLLGTIQLRALVGAEVIASAAVGVAAALLYRETRLRDDPRAILTRWSWIAAAPLLWAIASAPFVPADNGSRTAMTACRAAFTATLASAPAGIVAATSNFGAWLLLTTPQSVLAAPYHRDVAGILAVDGIFTQGDGADALRASGATYLAICRQDPELATMALRAPDGLAARLLAGSRPAWLDPVSADEQAEIYRVVAHEPPAMPDITGSLPPLHLRQSLPD